MVRLVKLWTGGFAAFSAARGAPLAPLCSKCLRDGNELDDKFVKTALLCSVLSWFRSAPLALEMPLDDNEA